MVSDTIACAQTPAVTIDSANAIHAILAALGILMSFLTESGYITDPGAHR